MLFVNVLISNPMNLILHECDPERVGVCMGRIFMLCKLMFLITYVYIWHLDDIFLKTIIVNVSLFLSNFYLKMHCFTFWCLQKLSIDWKVTFSASAWPPSQLLFVFLCKYMSSLLHIKMLETCLCIIFKVYLLFFCSFQEEVNYTINTWYKLCTFIPKNTSNVK